MNELTLNARFQANPFKWNFMVYVELDVTLESAISLAAYNVGEISNNWLMYTLQYSYLHYGAQISEVSFLAIGYKTRQGETVKILTLLSCSDICRSRRRCRSENEQIQLALGQTTILIGLNVPCNTCLAKYLTLDVRSSEHHLDNLVYL